MSNEGGAHGSTDIATGESPAPKRSLALFGASPGAPGVIGLRAPGDALGIPGTGQFKQTGAGRGLSVPVYGHPNGVERKLVLNAPSRPAGSRGTSAAGVTGPRAKLRVPVYVSCR